MNLLEREETNMLKPVDGQGICSHCGWKQRRSQVNLDEKAISKSIEVKSSVRYHVIM